MSGRLKLDLATDMLGAIDVQPSFMPGGELPVPDGDAIVPVINHLLADRFLNAFATQDWHPPGHSSFASMHPGRNPYDVVSMPYGPQMLWPDHAIQGSRYAALHTELDSTRFGLILRKGLDPALDGYSAFRDNDGTSRTGLAGLLQARGVKRLFLCGLAGDVCVAWSAEDAIEAGFETYIVEDATRSIGMTLPDGGNSADIARKRLEDCGVVFVTSNDLTL